MERKEVWLPVVGYEGSYEVSDLGRVWSVARVITRSDGHPKTIPYKIKNLYKEDSGYMCVGLGIGGKHTSYRIHTLVLTAFVGPRPSGMECCHYPDRDRSNNALSNLRWGTRGDNRQDSIIHGTLLRGSKIKQSKLTETIVSEIRHRRSNGEEITRLALEFGVSFRCVFRAVHRESWTHVP